jgi:hypothetical protein
VAIRIEQIERYLLHRYGRTLPDDDAGRHDLTILLNHLAQNRAGNPHGKMRAALRVWARWMPDDEANELIAQILKRPRRYTAKKLGELTLLTEEEHKLLGITSWWPHTWKEDKVRADQRGRKQARDRDAVTAKRRKAGVVSRDEYLANSKSRTEPWKAEGVSRRTWERRRKAEDCRKSVASIRESSNRSDTLATPPIWMTDMPPSDVMKLIKLTSGVSISLAKIGIVDMPMAA